MSDELYFWLSASIATLALLGFVISLVVMIATEESCKPPPTIATKRDALAVEKEKVRV